MHGSFLSRVEDDCSTATTPLTTSHCSKLPTVFQNPVATVLRRVHIMSVNIMSNANLRQPGLHSTRVPGRSMLQRQAVSLRSQLYNRNQNSTVSPAAAIDAPASASVTSMGTEELQARVDCFLAGYRNSQHIEHAYWVEESMVGIQQSMPQSTPYNNPLQAPACCQVPCSLATLPSCV